MFFLSLGSFSAILFSSKYSLLSLRSFSFSKKPAFSAIDGNASSGERSFESIYPPVTAQARIMTAFSLRPRMNCRTSSRVSSLPSSVLMREWSIFK